MHRLLVVLKMQEPDEPGSVTPEFQGVEPRAGRPSDRRQVALEPPGLSAV